MFFQNTNTIYLNKHLPGGSIYKPPEYRYPLGERTITLKDTGRIILASLLLLSLFAPVNSIGVGEPSCIFILTPTAWYMNTPGENITGNITVSLRYRLSNITINTSVEEPSWTIIHGFLENNTVVIDLYGGGKVSRGYSYTGNASDLIGSLLDDTEASLVNGVYGENISLKLNDTLTYNLLNHSIDFWSPTRQRIVIVDFRVRASNTPLIALGVTVSAIGNGIRYNVTYYADSIHREIFIPVNPRDILLNGSSSIDSINVTVKAYHDFDGVVDIVLYVLEFPQPVIDVRVNGLKTSCRPYVFLSPVNAPKAVASAVQRYYAKITSPPTRVYGTVRRDDELLFDYTYKVDMNITDREALNKSRLGFLIHVFDDLFNSTRIRFNWTTSIQFKVNTVVGGIINYVLRILQLRAKYNPRPVQGVSKPICGDGVLGVCPILWLSKLRGSDSTISRALAVLPSPGTTAVSSIEWPHLPWATDVAFPGYQATPENLVMKPLLFTRVYLGYPFASLTILPGAVWFTGKGRVEESSYGNYRGIPVVGLRFHGEDYRGYIYIDTFYLSPIKAFFEGAPGSWRSIGIGYNVHYSLDLFRWRGFWRNLTTTVIPVRIESKRSDVELLLIITQPGAKAVNAIVDNDTIELEVSTNTPTRILILGKGRPFDVTGAYWIALPLISDVDIVYPTTLVYIDQDEQATYNFIAAFPVITADSPTIRLLVLNGDKWLIDNVSVGNPFPINNSRVELPAPTTQPSPSEKTNTTAGGSEGKETQVNIVGENTRLITGLTIFIAAVIIILAYKRLGKKR